MRKNKIIEIEKFYSANREMLLSEINKLVNNKELAEEIFHEGMFKCIKDINRWGGYENLTTEAFMNVCKCIINSMYFENFSRVKVNIFGLDPLDIVIREETIQNMVHKMDELKTYSSVLKLYFFEKLTVKEISAMLNLKLDTVSKQIRRGRNMLKREWE
ncbi:MAG: sigma-70 family RNA polymerase sigma factor [Clostridia bacterium]|nr:sigma-70 family RNA polymerase sigma factor [Clostridia bacterium]